MGNRGRRRGGSAQYSGQASYNADLTYSLNVTLSGIETLVLPASCLGMTCAEADQTYQTTPPPGATSAHCSSSGANCACTIVISNEPAHETGTYTLSGSSVTSTASTGGVETDQYCVQGNHLDIIPSSNGLGAGGTSSGSIGLVKQ